MQGGPAWQAEPNTALAIPRMLAAEAPLLRWQLLAWWDQHGRHTIPWKVGGDGLPAADGEPLDPLPIWVAEVMRAARQHSCSTAGWP